MKDVRIHPMALVETQLIGEGTRIWAFTHLMEGASVGEHCNIGEHCYIESRVEVGSNVTIKNGNMLWEGVVVEDGAFIGPGVVFTNDRYPRSPRLAQAKQRYSTPAWLVRTVVGQGASLGGGAVIVCGVHIGEYALVAAGSVVTKNVKPHALVAGNPARVRGWVCRCGHPLEFDGLTARCSECGLLFERAGDLVRPAVASLAASTSRAIDQAEASQRG